MRNDREISRRFRVNLSVRAAERYLIEAAARVRHERPTEFARNATLERAREVLVGGS